MESTNNKAVIPSSVVFFDRCSMQIYVIRIYQVTNNSSELTWDEKDTLQGFSLGNPLLIQACAPMHNTSYLFTTSVDSSPIKPQYTLKIPFYWVYYWRQIFRRTERHTPLHNLVNTFSENEMQLIRVVFKFAICQLFGKPIHRIVVIKHSGMTLAITGRTFHTISESIT